MKQYALNQLFPSTMSPEKRKKQPRSQHPHQSANGHGSCRPRDYEKALRSLNLCKEVVDGIRIYFDHTLSGLLLYEQEREQYEVEVDCQFHGEANAKLQAQGKTTPTKTVIKQEQPHQSCGNAGKLLIEDFMTVQVKEEPRTSFGDSDKDLSDLRLEMNLKSPSREDRHSEEKGVRRQDRLRELCHDYKDDFSKFTRFETSAENRTEGASQPFLGTFHHATSSAASTSSCCSTPSCATPSHVSTTIHDRASINSLGMTARENALLKRIMNWKMIPEGVGAVNVPSQLYGAPHLARLFVKLPDLLHASGMHEKKLKILLGYLHSFLEYLEEHADWFGETHYKENRSLPV